MKDSRYQKWLYNNSRTQAKCPEGRRQPRRRDIQWTWTMLLADWYQGPWWPGLAGQVHQSFKSWCWCACIMCVHPHGLGVSYPPLWSFLGNFWGQCIGQSKWLRGMCAHKSVQFITFLPQKLLYSFIKWESSKPLKSVVWWPFRINQPR